MLGRHHVRVILSSSLKEERVSCGFCIVHGVKVQHVPITSLESPEVVGIKRVHNFQRVGAFKVKILIDLCTGPFAASSGLSSPVGPPEIAWRATACHRVPGKPGITCPGLIQRVPARTVVPWRIAAHAHISGHCWHSLKLPVFQ